MSGHPEFVGAVVLGGLAGAVSTQRFDQYSDLDCAIFISLTAGSEAGIDDRRERLPSWLPPFACPIPWREHPHGHVVANFHQMLVETEERASDLWPDAKRFAFKETSEIMIDPTGRVGRIIDRQTTWNQAHELPRLVRRLAQARWYGTINPIRQFERGHPVVAHDLVNSGADLLTEALFLLNRRFPPHKKWRLTLLPSLPRAPADIDERIAEVLRVDGYSGASISRRVEIFQTLLDETTELARDVVDLPADLDVASAWMSFPDRQLRGPSCEPLPSWVPRTDDVGPSDQDDLRLCLMPRRAPDNGVIPVA